MLRGAVVLTPRTPLFLSSIPRTVSSNKMSTMAGPVYPKFIPVKQSEITSVSKAEGFRFRLVSYNILAQAYVKSALFPHSPSPCLKWKTRSPAILDLLKSLDADFLCLQELDEYETFYKGNIEPHGYSSIYIQRSGQKRDGCGIFYKHMNSELVIEEQIEYNDLLNSLEDGTTSSLDQESSANRKEGGETNEGLETDPCDRGDLNDPRVRLKRDCVGIMAAFKLKDPSQRFVIVTNTHLYWDPALADVKLAQAKYLLSRVAQFRKMVSDKFDTSPSVIIVGDFNSVPGDKVYQYLVSGGPMAAPSPECLEDLPIPLCSVYAYTKGVEPQFTNCTPGFTGTLDYILFSPSGDIEPVGYLELPEAESPDVNGGLPNYYHPSDHLPIGAEFLVV